MKTKLVELTIREIEIIHGMAVINHQSLVDSPAEFNKELVEFAAIISKMESAGEEEDVTRKNYGIEECESICPNDEYFSC